MNSTFLQLVSGCSFRGFQSFLRRSEGGGRAEDGASDADWSSGGGGVFYCYFPPTPHGMVNSMVAEELMRRGLHINCLPEEILIKIFSNLAARDIIRSVLPVCRLWYKLGYDPVLWKSLEFSYRSEHSCPNMIRTVTQRHEHNYIRSIALKDFRSDQQMDQMLRHVGNHCSRLKEVELLNCCVRSDTLIRLGMTCPNIESLTLLCCDENYRKNHYMWAYMKDASFLVSFPKLTSLILFRTLASLSYDDAQCIVRVCKNLKKLVLSCDFYGRAIRLIVSSLSHCLEVLWLEGRNYNDSMIQEISKCHRLRKLGLNHVENITPFGLKFIGRLSGLEKLLLFHANNITPRCFADFFGNKNLKNLNYVNLSGCKGADKTVEKAVRSSCPKVREVILDSSSSKSSAYVHFGIARGWNDS